MYGVEIFAPAGACKGVAKLRALNRANTMCTLEACAISQSKKKTILDKSASIAAKRKETVKNAAKNGSILVKTENVSHHVMQRKHCWEKVIELSGDVKVDFKNVLKLLEKEEIISHQYLNNSTQVAEGIIRKVYEKTILNQRVRAIVIEYGGSKEVFLNDAWVVTR